MIGLNIFEFHHAPITLITRIRGSDVYSRGTHFALFRIMQTPVRALTEKRKENLIHSGKGQNSLHEPGTKPSGPDFSGYARGGKFLGSPAKGVAWIGFGIASAVGGIGLRKQSKMLGNVALVLGAGLIYRGLRDLFHPTDLMTRRETGMNNPAASLQHLEGVKIEESIIIDRPASELYRFWRDLSNLPRIMRYLDHIEPLDDYRSHWYVKAPFGVKLDWDAEIYREKQDTLISWRSLEGSTIATAGSVLFESLSGEATKVTIMMKVEPPLNGLSTSLAKLFGEDPSLQVKEDLESFKRLMEAA
jgi:uncharacterized membrane protein